MMLMKNPPKESLPRPPSKVYARKVFGSFERYGVEEEKRSRVGSAVVGDDKVLEKIMKTWRSNFVLQIENNFGGDFGSDRAPNYESYYLSMKRLEEMKGFDAEDIERFSLLLGVLSNEVHFDARAAGMFLSELINNGNGEDFTIHTKHLSTVIENIGYCNEKNITINGKAKTVGPRMCKGKIIVEEDTGHVGGMMSGGVIIVKQNARIVGPGMEGGTIYLNGEYGKIAQGFKGGEIYHKGVLILKK